MKVICKLTVFLSIPLALSSICGCNKDKSTYTSIKSLGPYIHEIFYDDYVEDVDHETTLVTDKQEYSFGCSSIRNGNYFGRNFDFYFSDTPSFVCHVKNNGNRFASVGVANHLQLIDNDVINMEKENKHFHAFDIIPSFTLDGINENGVVCNTNIVDISDANGMITGTNPGKRKVYLRHLVRFVLDNAKSADDAINLLNDSDVFATEDMVYNNHFMIADKEKTYIVEFINNEMRAIEKKDDDRIMTNFYNNMTQAEINKTYEGYFYIGLPKYNLNAIGTERYEFIKKNYQYTNTIKGMQSVLDDVRYSLLYLNPLYPDFPSEDFNQVDIKNNNFGRYRNIYLTTRNILDNNLRNLGYSGDTWITMHSSIYNIEEKSFQLIVQENSKNIYNFSL